MMHRNKRLLASSVFAFALSGNAYAMKADLDNVPGIGPDFTFEMCERWDDDKWQKFEDLLQSKLEKKEHHFPQKVTIRWEEKWGEIEDWSNFPGNHRPFKGFHLKEHFHATNNAPSPVPVPAAVWLFGSGLLGLIGIARRNRAE